MPDRRADRRRGDYRAFRPTLDGQLEKKLLLSSKVIHYPIPGQIQTAYNGQAVRLTTNTGQSFYLSLSSILPGIAAVTTTTGTTSGQSSFTGIDGTVASPTGTIQAYRMSGGRFGLILRGTDATTQLAINPLYDPRVFGVAHQFNPRPGNYTNMINIGAITVTSGAIDSIVGYHTAVLSGTVSSLGTAPIDRIAFDAILPGSSIFTGGDLNTLDVLESATFSGAGTGISVGRDLNFISAGGSLTIANNAVLNVGRDLGLAFQVAKGTGPGGQGGSIQGNLTISNGGKINIFRYLDAPFNVNGRGTGISNATISVGGALPGATFFFVGGSSP
jgi:hypothetical protein